jgi:DNA-binding CsgD family transcriptional regulator
MPCRAGYTPGVMARKRGYELGRQLTPRDQEVLALLRRGLTDAEIAASLGISRRGASYHVSQIIAKLEVRNRYEAAAWPDRPPWLAGLPFIAMWRELRRVTANVATHLSAPAAAAALATALLALGVLAFFIARTPHHDATIQASGPTVASTARASTPRDDNVSVAIVPSATRAPAAAARPTDETPPLAVVVTEEAETPLVTSEVTPTPTLPGWRVISAGNGHACAITSVASLKCWGHNERGQLGDGTTSNSSPPVTVDLGLSVIDVVAGNFYTCAVTIDGAVSCWGFDNYSGLLGPGVTQSSNPVKVIESGSGVHEVAGGIQHVCALNGAGKVLCWGWQAAPGMRDHGPPLEVSGVEGVTSIAAGSEQTCAVLDSGHAECWGGVWGPSELVDGRGQPLVDVTQISAWSGVCVRTNGGSAQCKRGINVDGDFESVVDDSGSPLTGIVDVQGDWYRGCVLTSDGRVRCWNNPTPTDSGIITAVDVPGLESGVASLGSYYGGCFMMQDGTAECWGGNGTLEDIVGIR